jgi:phage terminase large subunit-like protein
MKPGTWITTIHFRDKRLFDEFILSNKTSGISLEGLFEEVPFNFFDIKKEDFIEPKPGQSKEDYIAECIPYAIKEGKTQDEAAGMCYGMWDNKFVDIEEEDMMEKNAEELVKMLEELLKEMDKSL